MDKKKLKVLFLILYGFNGPSSRYRVYQYLPFLDKEGIEYSKFPFYTDIFERISCNMFKISNILGSGFNKIYVYWGYLKRLFQILLAARYDVIFIQKDLIPHVLIQVLHTQNKNIIFDFDDAIFLSDEKQKQCIGRVIRPNGYIKVPRILRASKKIIVGNKYLKEYCLKFNANVSVLPISIDTKRYFVKHKEKQQNLVIGWLGSPATVFCLEILNDVFKSICKKYPSVKIMLIGADSFANPNKSNISIKRWNYETEINDLQEFDIGLMPMSDDEFTQGKGGCKLLQYMAVGLPSVVSPVGINREIVKEGVDGFFASDPQEWIEKISLLIEDKKLREKISQQARETVVKHYSLEKAGPQFMQTIKEVLR